MPIQLTVFPDECDTFGHLHQAAYLSMFERARWLLLAQGPGMDVFQRAGAWPAVRRTTIDYHAGAWPGDVLGFDVEVVQRGRTSFTLRQRAVRVGDQRLVAVAEIVFVCIDANQKPVAVPDEVFAAMSGVQRIALSTGVTLSVEARGQGGAALLLVHGYPFDHSMWRAQLDGIAGHRIIAPDLRGMGESTDPELPAGAATTLGTHADDLLALLDALTIPRVVLCGLSMGGYIAFEFLRRYPDRVQALVLMDTRPGADSAEGRLGRDKAIALAAQGGAAAIADSMIGKLLSAAADSAVRDAVLAMMQRAPVEGIVASLGAMRDRTDATAMLTTIDVPTLIVVGAEDQLTPPDQATAMATVIPGATLEVIAGAGHVPPMERSRETNAILQRFLDRVCES